MATLNSAPGAAASPRTAVLVGQGRSPDAPPPSVHCDHAPSDPSAVATPVVLDLDPLRLAGVSIDTFMNSYHDLLAKHQQTLRDLTAARRHNEELHALARPRWDTARRFVDFAQHRYDVSQGRLRQAIQREAEATQDNERLRIEMRGFGDLRARYSLLEDTTTETYARLQDYAVGLERRLATSQHSFATDPSIDSPSLAQDLLDLRDENVELRQRNIDFASSCRTANADRDTALKDLSRLQKDRADLQRCYKQRKQHIRDLEREVQHLKKGLHHARQRLEGSASAADLQTLRLEVHVRGERVIELENLLAKAERRREDLHRVHDHTVGKLEVARREILDLQRQLGSTQRQHTRAEETLHKTQDGFRNLRSDQDVLSRARDTVVRELKKVQQQ
ncbi:hypothetical protein PHYPSEUDO_000652 [Phytophthora pseudosyringae]|uniref:Uncharacterized protein n=1 Tax=Phytophthora pseudosyringae TaxID=221518 RepID=A0A8T1V626_9STRA|nr:hypothetical protein PHYPSEUDO_000652 [Phytophthora pseudosyringae]